MAAFLLSLVAMRLKVRWCIGRLSPAAAMMVLSCILLSSASDACANDVTTLAAAMRDLQVTYGRGYTLDSATVEAVTAFGSSPAGGDPKAFERAQRVALLANPALSAWPILFVVRQQYRRDHHNTATFFPAALHERNDGAFTPGGALKMIEPRSGKVTTLLKAPQGVIRDPEVHFDGGKIVFSMRTNAADSYHIYEMKADGSRLRQLTFARDVDDLDPLYLPDDSIVFSSTREPKYCMCNRHIMANLFRMEADGANIHQIGKSTLFEGHASLLPDGRILYDRWEYVDRNFGDAQGLWAVNPDGSAHVVYWGNNTAAPGAVLDGRAIPGTERVICTFGSCHDRPWGALAIIDRGLGLDGPEPVVKTWPASAAGLVKKDGWQIFDAFTRVQTKYEDPWPLSDKYFLCSRMTGRGEEMGIYLLDVFGNEVLVHSEAPGCYDPMPLAPRARPPHLPARREFDSRPGFFYVHNVYRGTHMANVKPGTVKFLRVVESPEKRTWTSPSWNGQGQAAPAMNWHDFNNKRILGTVPVEPDGSVFFSLPAERFVYFQLLDGEGKMIQSMRSGVIAQPGETTSCVGCHEDRRSAPPPAVSTASRAAYRGPSSLAPWFGPERLFSYRAEVQPVFDRHCVRCHDFGTDGGKTVNLAADRDLVFNVSYNELWRKKFIKVVGAGPAEIQDAYAWGSHASRLTATLEQSHYDVRLTREEKDRVFTWMDLNAPYYPSYASAHPANYAGRAPLDNKQLGRLEQLTGATLSRTADHSKNPGPQISFDRPELSPCLARLDSGDPRRIEAVAIIRAGQENFARMPETDAPGFVPCEMDQWRESKYAMREDAENRRRAAMRAQNKVYDTP